MTTAAGVVMVDDFLRDVAGGEAIMPTTITIGVADPDQTSQRLRSAFHGKRQGNRISS
ncbi:MAG: hypothetical protein ACREP2_14255 [Rhodanobacteraceae bacterium]